MEPVPYLLRENLRKPVYQPLRRWMESISWTVEGLSDVEKDVYTYAFGEVGAVQCGFCIPGMVICAKGLLDQNLTNQTGDCLCPA